MFPVVLLDIDKHRLTIILFLLPYSKAFKQCFKDQIEIFLTNITACLGSYCKCFYGP